MRAKRKMSAPTDFITFTVVTSVLVVTRLLAGYIPAPRAAKGDPMVALGCEWAHSDPIPRASITSSGAMETGTNSSPDFQILKRVPGMSEVET